MVIAAVHLQQGIAPPVPCIYPKQPTGSSQKYQALPQDACYDQGCALFFLKSSTLIRGALYLPDNLTYLTKTIRIAREDQSGEEKKTTPRQDGYATRSCPPLRRCDRKNEKQTKTNNKQTKTESTTKNRLATHQDKQDIFRKSTKERKERKTKQNTTKSHSEQPQQFAVYE